MGPDSDRGVIFVGLYCPDPWVYHGRVLGQLERLQQELNDLRQEKGELEKRITVQIQRELLEWERDRDIRNWSRSNGRSRRRAYSLPIVPDGHDEDAVAAHDALKDAGLLDSDEERDLLENESQWRLARRELKGKSAVRNGSYSRVSAAALLRGASGQDWRTGSAMDDPKLGDPGATTTGSSHREGVSKGVSWASDLAAVEEDTDGVLKEE